MCMLREIHRNEKIPLCVKGLKQLFFKGGHMSNLQELREHLKELENSFEIGSFTKENIKEYAKCFFMSLSMFLERTRKKPTRRVFRTRYQRKSRRAH